jgi:hypothetical protein
MTDCCMTPLPYWWVTFLVDILADDLDFHWIRDWILSDLCTS